MLDIPDGCCYQGVGGQKMFNFAENGCPVGCN